MAVSGLDAVGPDNKARYSALFHIWNSEVRRHQTSRTH